MALNIDYKLEERSLEIYKRTGGGWTFDAAEAELRKGEPVKLRPSEINHGNITPSLKHEDKNTRKQV